jgi:SNF2 family DNA or RNA helicase
MNVCTTQPFQIIYSLFQHEFLGYLFETFVIQVDSSGRLTLRNQNISLKNCNEFSDGLDENDFKLIKLIDDINQDAIVKKFFNKKISVSDFFAKVYNKEKGDKVLQETIATYIQDRKTDIFELLKDKLIFEMGSDGEPTWKQVFIAEQKATVLFHFVRNEDNTHYFPTIKYNGEKLDFQYKSAIIVSNTPAWLLLGDKLYSFEKDVDGNKLKPFLNKKFIIVPRKVEETYFQKFVAPLIANFDVYARGFSINSERASPVPILSFSELASSNGKDLFGQAGSAIDEYEEGKLVFSLVYQYGTHVFSSEIQAPSFVKMEKTPDSYIFHKVKRSVEWEKAIKKELKEIGLELKNGKKVVDKSTAFSWLAQYKETLENSGILVKQSIKDQKKYFVGSSSISLVVNESNDWFDVNAIVRFGEFEIPFLQLRKYILSKKHEFALPNGEIAVIPEHWFSEYSDFFAFMEQGNEDGMILKKHHISLVQEFHDGKLANISIDKKLEALRNFETIDDVALPENFKGELRPYQKAGYNWMLFLNKFKFGGCLADDMGLGKTVQTLAMLQYQKENGAQSASLLIMPTSLLYNWEMEAKKFTPELKVFNYTGINREKNTEQFWDYDIVLTSYGTVRRDIDLLQEYVFHYIILDESQAIKNPDSIIAQSVNDLNSKHKLILTGTPIENSTLDIWSQMSFVNPGLLGSQTFFRNEFLVPIEKKQDDAKVKKLYTIIKPFILRRQKSQVATELPEKVENIQYCSMTEEQEKEYEKVKSEYRNLILENMEQKSGSGNSQFILLQGLTKLRQIANHPRLVDEHYAADSGKMEDVLHMMDRALAENHKILIFSQFVKHLALVREHLIKSGIDHAYLDGSTKERQGQVELFQNNDDIRVFLISLKAGGLGLNLTAADYVFILDPWWNPAIEAQAVDRAYRIGQKNQVFTYKFITKNTVEEKILNLQRSKQKLADELITAEESFVKSLSREDIQSIFD